jgi:nucleoside-diphosphate-sugar epimerase
MTNPAMNVLVTGAASELGREVIRKLVAHGHSVVGLTSGAHNGSLVRAEGAIPAFSNMTSKGEMKSVLKMAKADLVINLAGQEANGFPIKDTPFAEATALYQHGVAGLLDAAQAEGSPVKRLVHLSLTALYGDSHGEPVDEDTPLRADDPFEQAAIQAEERVLNVPIPAWVLRAGTLYGALDAGTQAIQAALLGGRNLYFGDSHALRGWIYISDLADAVVRAAEQDGPDQVVNVVDDHPASAAELVAHMAGGLGLPTPAGVSVPAFMSRFVLAPLQEKLLNSSHKVSNARAKSLLGWSPRFPNYRAGLDQVMMNWRAEG